MNNPETKTIYLVILSGEYVDAIFRDPDAANEYKKERERNYARMTDRPPQLRIDERVLR